ncbi:MAG: hypothetical protein JNM21_06430 [Taibaiella sp.]|nr:hypothetical protein [Taibaiella sp.]
MNKCPKNYFRFIALVIFLSPLQGLAQGLNKGLASGIEQQVTLADTPAIRQKINRAIEQFNTNLPLVESTLKQTLESSMQLNYYNGIVASYANLAFVENQKGNYSKAISYYNSAKPYLNKGLHNRTSLAMFYSANAVPYSYLSKFDSVYYFAIKAINLIDSLQPANSYEANDMMSVYNTLGVLWGIVDNPEQSLALLAKAKNIGDTFPQQSRLLQITHDLTLLNIGKLYLDKGALDTAIAYFQDMLKKGTNNTLSALYLAQAYLGKADTPAAVPLLQEVIFFADSMHLFTHAVDARLSLANIYLKQSEFSKALPLLLSAAQHINKNPETSLETRYESNKLLAQYYGAQGDYNKAFDYLQSNIAIAEKIKQEDKRLSVYKMEAARIAAAINADNEAKNLELKLAKNKLQNKNISIIALTILALIIIAWVLYSIRMIRKRAKAELKQKEQEVEITRLQSINKGEEQERSRLAKEIHDGILIQLANIKTNIKYLPKALETASIQDYIASAHFKNIEQLIDQTAKEMRHAAHNLMPEFLLESGLEAALFYFCNSTLKQVGIQLEFQWLGNPLSLPKDAVLSIFRIIQELIQNIIKHAQATNVLVQISNLDEDGITITVEDNGKGFDLLHKGNGIGISNIKSRVHLLHGKFDLRSDIGKGCSVFIELDTLSLLENKT